MTRGRGSRYIPRVPQGIGGITGYHRVSQGFTGFRAASPPSAAASPPRAAASALCTSRLSASDHRWGYFLDFDVLRTKHVVLSTAGGTSGLYSMSVHASVVMKSRYFHPVGVEIALYTKPAAAAAPRAAAAAAARRRAPARGPTLVTRVSISTVYHDLGSTGYRGYHRVSQGFTGFHRVSSAETASRQSSAGYVFEASPHSRAASGG